MGNNINYEKVLKEEIGSEAYKKMKEQLLEELKKEYVLTPVKEKEFTVIDIIEDNMKEMCEKCNINANINNRQTIGMAIRKIVCLHFGIDQIKHVPKEKRTEFREETTRLIKEYILGGK